MLFGTFDCPTMGTFTASSPDDRILDVVDQLSEMTGYQVNPLDVDWFQGIPRVLKPIRYEFAD